MTLDQLIESGVAVVALYGARWAPATAVLRKTAAADVTASGCEFVYVDCDEQAAMADRRAVVNLPLGVAYAAGRELDRTKGAFGTEDLARLARIARSYGERASTDRSQP